MSELYRLTATDALRLIQRGEVTVEEYAKSLLARIRDREHLHAWAYLDPDLVLNQAKELDKVPVEKRGPLHGLAVGIKDIALTKGILAGGHSSVIIKIDQPSRYANEIQLSNL